MIDPEIGFTSDVIKDSKRFVGRGELISDCIRAINTPLGVIAVYGKRGIGKSSLLRQIQQIALGDYAVAKNSGLTHLIPPRPRTYLTVYYQCDNIIKDATELLNRLCNDQNAEDGLLRLIPNEGKEVVEFTRSKEVSGGADLKVVNWGAKGIEASKYARVVQGDVVQTFRNFIESAVVHQVKKRMGRDGLLILLDEFDVIQDKHGLGSLIKSLSSPEVKFAVCGIGRDLTDLIQDHASVERLIDQGYLLVKRMNDDEAYAVFDTAERLFSGALRFDADVQKKIVQYSEGYPYFLQLLGRECVTQANDLRSNRVDDTIFKQVLNRIKMGKCFPSLETAYQRAIGSSIDRQLLLHLLADQPDEESLFNEDIGRVFLRRVRPEATDLDVTNIDQNIPRLLEPRYGPVLTKVEEKPGVYEFLNPVFRLYVRLRNF